MIYNIEKLEKLEKNWQKTLKGADNHHWNDPHKPYWLAYRKDMPDCLMVLREFKNLLSKLEEQDTKELGPAE
tara:strand:+ start:4063 stop:4278 length:216 start_codon:yes stop_codon:yes gene_type:complete